MRVKSRRFVAPLCTALFILCALCVYITLKGPNLLPSRFSYGLYIPQEGEAALVNRAADIAPQDYIAYVDRGIYCARVLEDLGEGYKIAENLMVYKTATLGRISYFIGHLGGIARFLAQNRYVVWAVSALFALTLLSLLFSQKWRYKRRYQKELLERFDRYAKEYEGKEGEL